ncbi:MAG: hypothetical protein LBL66_07670, partial [Clostridiales bacterium]|jgi:hypothetical protein|nr:hypothetical protein [Clostridiales bacterium]
LKSGAKFGAVGEPDAGALNYFRWYIVLKPEAGKERNVLVSYLSVETLAAEPAAVMTVSETREYAGPAPSPETVVVPPLGNGFNSKEEPLLARAEPKIDRSLPENGNAAIVVLLIAAIALTAAALACAALLVVLLVRKKRAKG